MKKNHLIFGLVLFLVSCGKNASAAETDFTALDSKKGKEAFTSLKEENEKQAEDNQHITLKSVFSVAETSGSKEKSFTVSRQFRLSLANGYAETEFKETYPSGTFTISHILNGETMYLYREVSLTEDGTSVLLANPTYTPVLIKDYKTDTDLGSDYCLDSETYDSLAANTDFVIAEGEDGSLRISYVYTDEDSRVITYAVTFDKEGRFAEREFTYTQTVNSVSYTVKATITADYSVFVFSVPDSSLYAAYDYSVYYRFGQAVRKLYSSIPLSLPGAIDPSQA